MDADLNELIKQIQQDFKSRHKSKESAVDEFIKDRHQDDK